MDMSKTGFQFINKERFHLDNIANIIFAGDIGCTSLTNQTKIILDKILQLQTKGTDLFYFTLWQRSFALFDKIGTVPIFSYFPFLAIK